jgi:hypothetical protein
MSVDRRPDSRVLEPAYRACRLPRRVWPTGRGARGAADCAEALTLVCGNPKSKRRIERKTVDTVESSVSTLESRGELCVRSCVLSRFVRLTSDAKSQPHGNGHGKCIYYSYRNSRTHVTSQWTVECWNWSRCPCGLPAHHRSSIWWSGSHRDYRCMSPPRTTSPPMTAPEAMSWLIE